MRFVWWLESVCALPFSSQWSRPVRLGGGTPSWGYCGSEWVKWDCAFVFFFFACYVEKVGYVWHAEYADERWRLLVRGCFFFKCLRINFEIIKYISESYINLLLQNKDSMNIINLIRQHLNNIYILNIHLNRIEISKKYNFLSSSYFNTTTICTIFY